MDRWDILLLVIGLAVAVSSLVRMMLSRRDKLVAQVKDQLAKHRKSSKARRSAASEKENAA